MSLKLEGVDTCAGGVAFSLRARIWGRRFAIFSFSKMKINFRTSVPVL